MTVSLRERGTFPASETEGSAGEAVGTASAPTGGGWLWLEPRLSVRAAERERRLCDLRSLVGGARKGPAPDLYTALGPSLEVGRRHRLVLDLDREIR